MTYVADDLGARLVGLLADAGSRKLTEFVLGDEQEFALQQATAAAVSSTGPISKPAGLFAYSAALAASL